MACKALQSVIKCSTISPPPLVMFILMIGCKAPCDYVIVIAICNLCCLPRSQWGSWKEDYKLLPPSAKRIPHEEVSGGWLKELPAEGN